MTATAEAPPLAPAPAPATDGLVQPAVVGAGRPRRSVDLALRVSVPVIVLGLWAWASSTGRIPATVFPSPWTVAEAFERSIADGTLWENLSVSLRRVAIGFTIGAAFGLVLGLVAGLFRLGDQLLDPSIQMLRTIPFLALAPLLVLWFGINELPKIIIIALAVSFPLYLNTYGGVRDVDPKLVEAGRVFGLGRFELIRRIVVPSALPSILVGLRMSLTLALIALIVAELTNAPKGLGFLMTSAQQFFQTDILVMVIVIYALWGLGVDLLVRLLERVLLPWKRARR